MNRKEKNLFLAKITEDAEREGKDVFFPMDSERSRIHRDLLPEISSISGISGTKKA